MGGFSQFPIFFLQIYQVILAYQIQDQNKEGGGGGWDPYLQK